MAPEGQYEFSADDELTDAADLRIELTTIRRGRRIRRRHASSLVSFLTRLRNLLSRARP